MLDYSYQPKSTLSRLRKRASRAQRLVRSRRGSPSTPQGICTTPLICCAAALAEGNAWPSWNKSWLLLGHKPSCRCHTLSLSLYCMHSRPVTSARIFAKSFCDELPPRRHWQAVSRHSTFTGQWAIFHGAGPALLYMHCVHGPDSLSVPKGGAQLKASLKPSPAQWECQSHSAASQILIQSIQG